MSGWLEFFFIILLIVVYLVSAIYITKASKILNNYKTADSDLDQAYHYAYLGATVLYVLIGLTIGVFVIAIIGIALLYKSGAARDAASTATQGGAVLKTKAANSGVSIITILAMIIAIGLVGATGVFAAAAASYISRSSLYSQNSSTLKPAYDDCIIAACVSIGTIGLLIIALITYVVLTRKSSDANEVELPTIKESSTA